MKSLNKKKLSSDLIFTKLICFFGAVLFLKLLFDGSKNNAEMDFKTDLGYKAFFLVSISFLVYFLTRPKIYYDEINLYIKKMNKMEIVIPLKNIKSFFKNPLSVSKGTAIFSIEFTDDSEGNDSVKFTAAYSSNSIKEFKIIIKKINPRVEIV